MPDPGVDRFFDRLDEVAPEGYNFGFHIRFSRPAHLRMTYSDAWSRYYSNHKFILADPSVVWALTNTGAKRWSEIETPDPLGVFAAAEQHGYRYGVAVGYGDMDSKTLGSAGRSDREFSDEEIGEICGIVRAVHDSMADKWQMSPRQQAALQLLSEDLTYDDICEKLSISRTALKSRLNGARRALGADSNAEAVRAGIERGIITSKSYTGVSTGLPAKP